MTKYIGRNHWFRYFVGTQCKGSHLVHFFVVRYLIFRCGFQYIRQKKENALSHNKKRNPDPNVFDNYTKCPSAWTFLGWGSISYI
jgi:hypothetical protein